MPGHPTPPTAPASRRPRGPALRRPARRRPTRHRPARTFVAATLAAAAGLAGLVGTDLSETVTAAPRARVAGSVTRATTAGRWWSGASGDDVTSSGYATWRGEAATVAGTWNDGYQAQVNQWTICPGGRLATWNRPLDLAVGAIYHSRGETWAAAARGAYDARWRTALTRIRTCWGSRSPTLLHVRFAHEFNLASSDWSVHRGEEAAFRTAMTRFSSLRYAVIPKARLAFAPNDATDGSLGIDVRTLFPGRDARGRRVADLYAVDSYNMWPHVVTDAQFQIKIMKTYSTGAPQGIEAHRRFAQSKGVPVAVSEWSNNGDGGESPQFVRSFHAWAARHAGNPNRPVAGQLLYEVQFNLWPQYQFWPSNRQPATAAAYRALRWGR